MDEKTLLRTGLQEVRDAMVWKLDGLSDADMRRPMTPTGTNLLGLVKHLTGLEYGYLGAAFGRPAPEPLPWMDDGSVWEGADMWVAKGESIEYIVGLYRRACAHADQTIAAFDLDQTGVVPWWPQERRRRACASWWSGCWGRRRATPGTRISSASSSMVRAAA